MAPSSSYHPTVKWFCPEHAGILHHDRIWQGWRTLRVNVNYTSTKVQLLQKMFHFAARPFETIRPGMVQLRMGSTFSSVLRKVMTLSKHPGDHHSSLSSLSSLFDLWGSKHRGYATLYSQLTATNLGRLDGQGCWIGIEVTHQNHRVTWLFGLITEKETCLNYSGHTFLPQPNVFNK